MVKVNAILGILIVISSGCLSIPENKIVSQQEIMELQAQTKEQNPILNKDYTIAKQALDKAVLQRDRETIRLGLQKKSLIFKKDVVQGIEQLNDKSFVPDLINVLENNQVAMTGGTETRLLQQELNEAIVSALKKITKLDFQFSEKISADDIQQVLKKSREWWNIYQRKHLPRNSVN
jgi:hypothetical protein